VIDNIYKRIQREEVILGAESARIIYYWKKDRLAQSCVKKLLKRGILSDKMINVIERAMLRCYRRAKEDGVGTK
jgi:hypothetical protein